MSAHQRQHELEGALVQAKIDAVVYVTNERWRLHADAHAIAEKATGDQSKLLANAVDKSDVAIEKRFDSVNEFRAQLRDQSQTFASSQRIDAMQVDINRRFEELRLAVTNIEKGDVKQEGRGLGQGAVIATIVSAIVVAGVLLGIIVNLGRL